MSRNDRSDANFDMARDELFSHIHRCGVLRSTQEQQEEWMTDTVQYMAERFPELSADQVSELRAIGLRFCRPVIHNAVSEEAAGKDSAEAAAA